MSGRNLDELNECSLAGGSGKQENNYSLSRPILWIFSVCEGKKEKNQTEDSSRYV